MQETLFLMEKIFCHPERSVAKSKDLLCNIVSYVYFVKLEVIVNRSFGYINFLIKIYSAQDDSNNYKSVTRSTSSNEVPPSKTFKIPS